MNVHKNARLTPHSRADSSRPHRLRSPTPETVVAEVERLRRQRFTGKQIAACREEAERSIATPLPKDRSEPSPPSGFSPDGESPTRLNRNPLYGYRT